MTDTAVARFVDCRKQYARRHPPALASLGFEATRGRVTALLGPNGSGKSTAFKAALGLIHLDGGSVELLGAPSPRELWRVAGRIGVVPDSPTWFPRYDGRTTLGLLATMAALPPARVEAVLDDVGLADAAGKRVGSLSLGMRQRLALAAAMLKEPELLVLDEPANGLDPAGTVQLRRFLRRFVDGGGSVLLSSHLLAEVEHLADDVVVIARGSVVEAGPLEEVLRRRSGTVIRFADRDPANAAALLRAEGFEVVERAAPDGPELVVLGGARPEEVARRLGSAGWWPSHLAVETDRLEHRYLDLVGDEEQAPWGR